MNLYIKNPVTTDLESFLKDYFNRRQPATYYNAEFNSIPQTTGGCRRSFGDLLTLSKTYFPGTTDKDLAKLIVLFCEEDFICGDYCNHIEKAVFYKFEKGYTQYWMYEAHKSFLGNDGYSHITIKQLADELVHKQ